MYVSRTKVSNDTLFEQKIIESAIERIMNVGLLDDIHECIQYVRYLHIKNEVNNSISSSNINPSDDYLVIGTFGTYWLLLIGSTFMTAFCCIFLFRISCWNCVNTGDSQTDSETDQSYPLSDL